MTESRIKIQLVSMSKHSRKFSFRSLKSKVLEFIKNELI